MTVLSRNLLILAPLWLGSQALAQGAGCNGSEDFNDFDFWLGQWNVTDNSSSNVAGSNTITKDLNNCLVMENWTGASGSIGKSINYFNPLRQEWRQVWVAPGYVIDITGGLENGAMVLTGSIDYFTDKRYDFRGSWTPSDDGSVRQFFEQYDPDSQEWNTWFDGRYEINQ